VRVPPLSRGKVSIAGIPEPVRIAGLTEAESEKYRAVSERFYLEHGMTDAEREAARQRRKAENQEYQRLRESGVKISRPEFRARYGAGASGSPVAR
jgi:hypothetical protein